MINEVLLAGASSVKTEAGQTKSGKLLAHAWIKMTDVLDDGRIFRTWLPISAYGKGAERLLTFNHSDLFIARGKITCSSEQGGLIVACRDVSKFAMPSVEEVEPNAAA
jgi:hypothetical protein